MHGPSLLLSLQPHKAPVADIAIDASGGYCATAGADRAVKVWDLQAGYATHSFLGHRWARRFRSRRPLHAGS